MPGKEKRSYCCEWHRWQSSEEGLTWIVHTDPQWEPSLGWELCCQGWVFQARSSCGLVLIQELQAGFLWLYRQGWFWKCSETCTCFWSLSECWKAADCFPWKPSLPKLFTLRAMWAMSWILCISKACKAPRFFPKARICVKVRWCAALWRQRLCFLISVLSVNVSAKHQRRKWSYRCQIIVREIELICFFLFWKRELFMFYCGLQIFKYLN